MACSGERAPQVTVAMAPEERWTEVMFGAGGTDQGEGQKVAIIISKMESFDESLPPSSVKSIKLNLSPSPAAVDATIST